MEKETLEISLRNENYNIFNGTLLIINNENIDDTISLELSFHSVKILVNADNCFDALINLRKELQKENMQILCNGAAINVYPSPMILSMGEGRLAYKIEKAKPTRKADLVDIFDCDNNLEFVTVEIQLNFFNEWVKSIR